MLAIIVRAGLPATRIASHERLAGQTVSRNHRGSSVQSAPREQRSQEIRSSMGSSVGLLFIRPEGIPRPASR